jgi:GT2 family glycosyltransferase
VSDAPGKETLSVVVCCFADERADLLARCLDSIRAQSTPVHEILLIVDHNPSMLQSLQHSLTDVVVMENRGERGLSGGRNTGVEAASGTIVAFVDDDAYVDPDWAKWVIAAYDDPIVVAVGGAVVPDFETDRPAWFPAELDWIIGCTYAGHRVDAGPVRNPIGANMSFRSSTLAEIGRFRSDLTVRSERFAGGCEETELCIRAGRAPNATLWFEPRAVAHHFVPRSRTTLRYMRRRSFGEGCSKALVARLAGRELGLESERTYVNRALPRAAMREVRAGLHGDRAAWARLVVLAGAPLVTAAGYAYGRVAGHGGVT